MIETGSSSAPYRPEGEWRPDYGELVANRARRARATPRAGGGAASCIWIFCSCSRTRARLVFADFRPLRLAQSERAGILEVERARDRQGGGIGGGRERGLPRALGYPRAEGGRRASRGHCVTGGSGVSRSRPTCRSKVCTKATLVTGSPKCSMPKFSGLGAAS